MLLKKIFDIILSFLDSFIPDSDGSQSLESLAYVFDEFLSILSNGIEILRMFLGSGALTALSIFLGLIIALNVFYLAYTLVMYVVSKIPFLGIK